MSLSDIPMMGSKVKRIAFISEPSTLMILQMLGWTADFKAEISLPIDSLQCWEGWFCKLIVRTVGLATFLRECMILSSESVLARNKCYIFIPSKGEGVPMATNVQFLCRLPGFGITLVVRLPSRQFRSLTRRAKSLRICLVPIRRWDGQTSLSVDTDAVKPGHAIINFFDIWSGVLIRIPTVLDELPECIGYPRI